MKLRMKLMSLPVLALLLQSCASTDWANDSTANDSALYDPPTITLVQGTEYWFKEGRLVGRKNHKFHSDYSYRRAVIVGDK